jgi:hypothetical protein
MTSVFMIFEITQDYQILVPLMVANLLSFVISRRYQPVSVYHALLHQDGIHLPSPGMLPVTSGRIARHVMNRHPIRCSGQPGRAGVAALGCARDRGIPGRYARLHRRHRHACAARGLAGRGESKRADRVTR